MAKYKKKRARELKHDRFRDTTINLMDRVGDRLEGKGRTILYAIAGLIVLAALAGLWSTWRARKAGEAHYALGRAIEIMEAPVTASPSPGSTTPSFPTESARAQKAIEEFQKVADNYSGERERARYFVATNLLVTDRNKGIGELEALSKSSDGEISTLAKFALAQAKEADAKYDEAATLYSELVKQNNAIITSDTANIRLAAVYQKQGKKKEAADILFNIVDAARKAPKGEDGKPAPQTAAAREAAQQLQKLDPSRYAQLPPETPASDLAL